MIVRTLLLPLALLLSVQAAEAAMLSTTSSANLAGLTFGSGDVVDYDAGAGTAALVFDDAALFDGSENVDAWSRYGAGWLLSTTTDSTIGGTAYLDGDLLYWDPISGAASLFMSEAVFGGSDEDIDAAHALEDGRLLLSTTSSANLGGVSFASGDAVLYDAGTGSASILFDGSDWFDATENLDALMQLQDGSLLMSTSTDGSAGAFTFLDGDVFRFDAGSFSTWFSETEFGGSDEDVNAYHQVEAAAVPVPASWLLLISGLTFSYCSGYSLTRRR